MKKITLSLIITMAVAVLVYLLLNVSNGKINVSKIVIPEKEPITVIELDQPLDGNRQEHIKALETLLASSSLQGTYPPGQIAIDGDRVVRNLSLKELFDYFLSLSGELDPREIAVLISKFGAISLNKKQLNDLLNAFDKYRGYQTQISEIDSTTYEGSSLQEKLNVIKEIRRKALGEHVAEAYFGYDERYDQYHLSKMKIFNDENRTAEEKQLAINNLFNQLPEELQHRKAKDRQLKSKVDVEQKIAEEEDATQRYLTRVETFGSEAASRLAELDEQRNQWQQRYRDYRDQADVIQASALSDFDAEQEINRLRERLFTAPEVARVKTLDELKVLE